MRITAHVWSKYDLRHTVDGTSSLERQIAKQILDNAPKEVQRIRKQIAALNRRLEELPEIAESANDLLKGGFFGGMNEQEFARYRGEMMAEDENEE